VLLGASTALIREEYKTVLSKESFRGKNQVEKKKEKKEAVKGSQLRPSQKKAYRKSNTPDFTLDNPELLKELRPAATSRHRLLPIRKKKL